MAKAKAEAVAVATLDRQEAEAMAKAEDSVLQPLSRSWDSATLQALAKAAPLPLQMAVAVASARPWDWEPPAADAWAKAAPKLWLAEPPPWELRAGVLGGGGGAGAEDAMGSRTQAAVGVVCGFSVQHLGSGAGGCTVRGAQRACSVGLPASAQQSLRHLAWQS